MKTLEDQIAELEQERLDLFAQKEPIDKRLGKNYDELKKLLDKQAKEKIKASNGKVDWDYLLTCNPESTVRYNEKNKQLEKISLTSSGYYPETNQYSLQFSLYKNNLDRLEKVFEGLKQILPFVKPISSYGCKVIGIMEKTLSEHGIYKLHVFDNGNCDLAFTRYSTDSILKKFANLKEALTYIMNNHPGTDYNIPYSEREEDEY